MSTPQFIGLCFLALSILILNYKTHRQDGDIHDLQIRVCELELPNTNPSCNIPKFIAL